jgi:hypothetical protein
MTDNKAVIFLTQYYESFNNYLHTNKNLRYIVGSLLILCFVLNWIPFSTITNMMYFGLFLISSRTILLSHTYKLDNTSNNTVNFEKILMWWTGLYFFDTSYKVLHHTSYHILESFILTSLINIVYLTFLLQVVNNLENEFTLNPLPKLLYVKRVELFGQNKDLHTKNYLNNIVNMSINFYRVNMKFYDHIFLNVIPNFSKQLFNTISESQNNLTNSTSKLYGNSKELFNNFQNKYISRENVLVQSQYIDSTKKEEPVLFVTSNEDNNEDKKQDTIESNKEEQILDS